MRILVVEDEQEVAVYLKFLFEEDGDEVTICDSISEVMDNHYEEDHELIILDLRLGREHGEKLVRHLRRNQSEIPILVLTALSQTDQKVKLFNEGIDDYVTKPFNEKELKARARALHRRYLKVRLEDGQTKGRITFYYKQRKVCRDDKTIQLTPKEAEVFEILWRHRGKTVSSEDIIESVWHPRLGYYSNILQSVIRRLRKKVDAGFEDKIIHNVHGTGYSLKLPSDAKRVEDEDEDEEMEPKSREKASA